MEVGPKRVAVMDEGDVRLKVVSHIPFVLRHQKNVGPRTYSYTHSRVPDRARKDWPHFATLPIADPAEIEPELERCTHNRAFVEILIPCHANGVFYDGTQYLPMWQAAERLNMLIYLHPSPPALEATVSSRSNYSEDVEFAISTHDW